MIDLMGGIVVHARLGDRAHYRPIRSRLCESARVEDVVAALLGLFAFSRLYVADLDALRGGRRQLRALDAIRGAAPGVALWIDAGVREPRDLRAIAARGTPVLASETISIGHADRLLAACPAAVLSVDYRGTRLMGEPALLGRAARWPAQVIAMNLARVGSSLGPDLKRIRALRRLAPHAKVYAAGGVRNAADLRRCRASGAAGALVASALHDGRIRAADLFALTPGPSPAARARGDRLPPAGRSRNDERSPLARAAGEGRG